MYNNSCNNFFAPKCNGINWIYPTNGSSHRLAYNIKYGGGWGYRVPRFRIADSGTDKKEAPPEGASAIISRIASSSWRRGRPIVLPFHHPSPTEGRCGHKPRHAYRKRSVPSSLPPSVPFDALCEP